MNTTQFTTFDSTGVSREIINRNIDIWKTNAKARVTKIDYITITEDDGRVIDRAVVYFKEDSPK